MVLVAAYRCDGTAVLRYLPSKLRLTFPEGETEHGYLVAGSAGRYQLQNDAGEQTPWSDEEQEGQTELSFYVSRSLFTACAGSGSVSAAGLLADRRG